MASADQQSNAGYAERATVLLKQYESLAFVDVHHRVLTYLPTTPVNILDVGAGTGRDAAHFAEQGNAVVAVEPTIELREGAQRLHPSPNITWLDDRLPELENTLALETTYDLIMLNAVWMHLNPHEQVHGMGTLARLSQSGTRLIFTLRHGPVPTGRVMYEVSGESTRALAAKYGFRPLLNTTSESVQAANRAAGVRWTTLVLER